MHFLIALLSNVVTHMLAFILNSIVEPLSIPSSCLRTDLPPSVSTFATEFILILTIGTFSKLFFPGLLAA